ncbi:peptidylprolyl isomerase [Kiloniella sp. EL199]|uniref:peptidylprolyl isomerase n=1 Tax=Kiloniella sp. EL199 TaxID=2107581 RepID=UPI000EA05C2F|nr:peptidylprolyl isomerase [Kiloniella sp. EL199]
MKRFIVANLLSIALIITTTTTSFAQDVLRPAAVVNDDIISLLDVAQRTQLVIVSSQRKNTPQVRQRMLRQVIGILVDERLKLQEAERLNITISDAQIQNALSSVAKQNNMTPQQLTTGLRKQGVLPITLFDQFRADLAWRAVVNTRLRSSVNISDAEIEEVVAKLQTKGSTTEKRIFEIFLGVDTVSDEANVKKQADEVITTIKNGGRFSALARQVSQSNSAGLGGDLGWLQTAQLSPELQPAVDSAPIGSLVGPIRTKRGYYVLLVQDQRSAKSEQKVHLKQFFFALPANPSFEQTQQVQSRAADAKRKFESCQEMDQLAKELGDEGSGDLGTLNTKDLPATTKTAVSQIAIGETTPVVQVSGGLAVIAVCDRQESGGVDRLAIQDKLTNDRLDTLARRYLLDLRRSSNVDIRL